MIKELTIKDISTRVEGLLRHYQTAINGVFESEGKIKISMPVELSYDRTMKGTKVKVGITFVTDKIDDTSTGYVDEEQGKLDLAPVAENTGTGELKRCPLRPNDLIYASFCNNSCPLRRAVILVDGVNMPQVAKEVPEEFIQDGTMIQYRSCAAWADDDTKQSVDWMLAEIMDSEKYDLVEDPGTLPLQTFRIMDSDTNMFWQGEARTAEDACDQAFLEIGGNSRFLVENCVIKTRSATGSWCKYKGGRRPDHDQDPRRLPAL